MRSLRPLVLSLTQQLGADVEYARPLNDRRYLTGVEVGLLLALGVVVRFVDGYLDGLIKKQGEKLGEQHAEAIRHAVQRLKRRFPRGHEITAAEAVTLSNDVEPDLAQVLEEILHLLKEKEVYYLVADRSELTADISAFLLEQGFPPEAAAEHAPLLVTPIEKFLAREQGAHT